MCGEEPTLVEGNHVWGRGVGYRSELRGMSMRIFHTAVSRYLLPANTVNSKQL